MVRSSWSPASVTPNTWSWASTGPVIATLEEYRSSTSATSIVSSGVALVAYCLWAFDQQIHRHGIVLFEISIVPFSAFLRYALLVERGEGGAPEDVVLADRPLQVSPHCGRIPAIGLYVT